MKHAAVLVLVVLLVLAMAAVVGFGPTMAAAHGGAFSPEGPQLNTSDVASPRVSSAPLAGRPQGAKLRASDVASPRVSNAPPLMFIENVGQFADGARFQMRCDAGTVWLADDALWLSLVDTSETGSDEPLLRGANVKLSFVGASPGVRLEPSDRLDTTVSYFIGNDPSGWHADVPVWGGVRYVGLYPGVDLEVTGEGGRWSWSLVGQDGIPLDLEAFPVGEDEIRLGSGDIRLRAEGADTLDLDESGWLYVATAAGEVAIPSLSSSNLLSVSDNPSELLYSTFLGGSDLDQDAHIAVDSNGVAYITGSTVSDDFPTSPGAYDDTGFPWDWDAFVVKLDTSGANLVYATYLGGDHVEIPGGIAVDVDGSAYVTGRTMADDFPTTLGAYDRTHNGGNDVFVAKLNAAGSQLMYSTFIGGSDWDDGLGIVLDSNRAAFIVGKTTSSDFPASSGAFDTSYNGGTDKGDCFVFKLSAAGSRRVYATYLGGSDDEEGMSIAVTSNGVACIAGNTKSNDFPTTSGALDTELGGPEDGFLVKLNAAGSQQVYATYLGGTNYDEAQDIAIGDGDVVYVVGTTYSLDFPVTEGAYDNSLVGGTDAYIAKLNSAGSALSYATYLGGSATERGRAICVDNGGAVYIAGDTSSSDFPATAGSYNASHNGWTWDAFAAKLDATGSFLSYATYLGGEADDHGYSIALDGSSNVYIAGHTESSDFPTTSGARDRSHNGSIDVFVSKLAMAATAPTPTVTATLATTPTPTVTATTEPCPDTYEPNENFYEAIEIVPGTDIDSYICSSTDDDYFKFDVVAGQQITVDLTNLPEDYDLRLWDPNDNRVDISNAGSTISEHIDYTAAMSGAYRVHVCGFDGVFDQLNPYRLRVEVGDTTTPTPTATMTPGGTHTPTPTVTPTLGPCPDTYEPNESFSEAIEIVPGIDIDSYICSSTDEDWFKFYVSVGQVITVELTSLPEDYDLYFFGPNGDYIDQSGNGGTMSEEIVSTAAMFGAYRACVVGCEQVFDVGDPYTLSVQVVGEQMPTPTSTSTLTPTGQPTVSVTPTQPPTPTPTTPAEWQVCCDVYESNDTLGTAIDLTPGRPIYSYIWSAQDVDFYKFVVLRGQTISVLLTNLPQDYDLLLYDPKNLLLEMTESPGTAQETIAQVAAVSGTYIVEVRAFAYAFDQRDGYTLSVTLGAAPSPTVRYVATSGSDSGNDCSNSGSPCGSIQYAVDQAHSGEEVRVAGGSYSDVEIRDGLRQVVYLDKNLSVLGGYTTSDWDSPDPTLNVTTIDAQRLGRGICITGTADFRIEGLHITGGDATGLGGDRLDDWDIGGGFLVYNGTSGLLRNCVVYSNTTGSATFAAGGGMALQGASITLYDNTIKLNSTLYFGGGIYSAWGHPMISHNTVISNTAGILGGGMAFHSRLPVVEANTIQGNCASEGGGVWLSYSEANLIDNMIVENTTARDGAGVDIEMGAVLLIGNTIVDNRVTHDIIPGSAVALCDSDSTLINNIVAGNSSVGTAVGITIEGSRPHLIHNTISDNRGSDSIGVLVIPESGDPSTAVFTNTIITGHTVGITVAQGSSVTLDSTLWYANSIDRSATGMITHYKDITGAPGFIDTAVGNYHIVAASAAFDRGVFTKVRSDIDGDCRPQGRAPDLGADELALIRPRMWLPMVLKRP